MARTSRQERILRLVERIAAQGVEAGIVHLEAEDPRLQGDSITVGGRRLLNFATAAYLGLNLDPRLKQGAIDAVERFGTVYSSSRAYHAADLYTALERRLEAMFGAPVLVPTTTTLGHLGVLPTVVTERDIVLVDAQTHATVHLTTQVLRGMGVPVVTLPHNDVAAVETAVADHAPLYERVWYLADGVYSMYGDVAPVDGLVPLLERHPNLWFYFDDAHGLGWSGLAGRGYILANAELHDRMIVAGSLAKAVGSGGAVVAMRDADMAARIRLIGTTFVFSGPLHPAELGAAVAAVDILLSSELDERQRRLRHLIDHTLAEADRLGIRLADRTPTPIWFVPVGGYEETARVVRGLMADGFYVNPAAFPAVPLGQAGLRFANTLYHTEDQLTALLEAIARRIGDEEPEIVVDLRDRAAQRADG